ncbi:Heavy metal RND efflux outer membrane protein, CzcC family [hydrothermal vent metagenome]|uniref:Heavy metal RND efflux outer membrane protein, CzcC family n=1 Tax=hydrothermal vent metagenome TaxID=652676 RepID=A0A1W1EFV6_9ZZZZ
MKKIIMIFLTFSLTLFGMSYENFKKQTLKNSKILKSQTLQLEATQYENNILLRTSNPTLSLDASRFDEKARNSGYDYGYSATATQEIRTGSYMTGLKSKAQASKLLSEAFATQGHAGYLKTLEMLYTQYVYQSKMLNLLKEEYGLSKRVTSMVKDRYISGSENRVSYLQAKTQTTTLKTQMYTNRQELSTLYYQLMAIAGFSKKVTLDKKFIYSVSSKVKHSSKLSPKEKVLKAQKNIYVSDLNMNKSSFQNYELYGGIEKEPDQSILKFGINIPISLHNDRSEERMLAKLKMQQNLLDQEQLSLTTRSQKNMIKVSIRELSSQYYELNSLQKEQKELTALLKEGYKISKGSLFQLMTAKNKLIQTRKALLQTQKIINDQKIELRFLQGDYNE